MAGPNPDAAAAKQDPMTAARELTLPDKPVPEALIAANELRRAVEDLGAG